MDLSACRFQTEHGQTVVYIAEDKEKYYLMDAEQKLLTGGFDEITPISREGFTSPLFRLKKDGLQRSFRPFVSSQEVGTKEYSDRVESFYVCLASEGEDRWED